MVRGDEPHFTLSLEEAFISIAKGTLEARLRYRGTSILCQPDNPHLPPMALGRDERSSFTNLPVQPGPIIPRPFHRCFLPSDAGHPFILVFLSAFTPTSAIVIAPPKAEKAPYLTTYSLLSET